MKEVNLVNIGFKIMLIQHLNKNFKYCVWIYLNIQYLMKIIV